MLPSCTCDFVFYGMLSLCFISSLELMYSLGWLLYSNRSRWRELTNKPPVTRTNAYLLGRTIPHFFKCASLASIALIAGTGFISTSCVGDNCGMTPAIPVILTIGAGLYMPSFCYELDDSQVWFVTTITHDCLLTFSVFSSFSFFSCAQHPPQYSLHNVSNTRKEDIFRAASVAKRVTTPAFLLALCATWVYLGVDWDFCSHIQWLVVGEVAAHLGGTLFTNLGVYISGTGSSGTTVRFVASCWSLM